MKTLSLILALALPLAAQPDLVNSDQLAAGLATKQDTITNGSITNAMLVNGAVANLSGTNTGDQTSVTGNAGTVTTINGRIAAGANVTITGAGTAASPYSIAATGGGGSVDEAADYVWTGTHDYSGATLTLPTFATINATVLNAGSLALSGTTITATATELNRVSGLGSAAVGLTDTQTLTNKTLTAPVLGGTITGTYTLGGTPTFPASVATLTGTQVLTNKTLTDASNVLPAEIGVALSDETTAITTGTAKVTIRMPFAMTLTGVRASLTTVSSSGLPTVDINEGGTTILSTKLTLDASEKTSTTAATAAVISDTALADDAEITFDIDVAGTGAAGLKIWLIGTR